MIHGKGTQYFLTKTYQDLREKGLLDADDLTTEEKSDTDITGDNGGGRTDPETYILEVQDIRIKRKSTSKKVYDIRKTDPRLGDMNE